MTKSKQAVWDPFVRLFHWTLVATIGFSWWSAGRGFDFEAGINWNQWHERSAYLVIALIVLRVIWGFVGSPYARFKSFIFSPVYTFRYLKALLQRKEKTQIGRASCRERG